MRHTPHSVFAGAVLLSTMLCLTSPALYGCSRSSEDTRTGATSGEKENGTDAALASEVARRLNAEGLQVGGGGPQGLADDEIKVVVASGVVTLSGKVESDQQRSKAEDLAKDVEGVEGVDNRIALQKGAANPEMNAPAAAGTPTPFSLSLDRA